MRFGWVALVIVAGFGCADDPVYLRPNPAALEANSPGGGGATMATVVVPVRLETLEETQAREALATRLGLTPDQVPSVRRDDIDLSIEWTIKNLEDADGEAMLSVVGANEYFRYDPGVFVIDPEEDRPPPPLAGGIPLSIPALATFSGVIREDEVAEAAQDLDAITRSGIIPEWAGLTRWDTGDVVDPAGTVLMPSAAIPALLEVDVSFAATTHMVLEYVVRVRDHSDRLRPDETDAAQLVQPSQTAYAPPAPMPMP